MNMFRKHGKTAALILLTEKMRVAIANKDAERIKELREELKRLRGK